jgi:hypothetical protein
MKLALLTLCSLMSAASIASAAPNTSTQTKVISKITDIYQKKSSGKYELKESEYQVGKFNLIDEMAENIETVTDVQKANTRANPVKAKLERVLAISDSKDQKILSQTVSEEICTLGADKKYCSTSIELKF